MPHQTGGTPQSAMQPALGKYTRGHSTIPYPGVAQLVARLLWERETQVRAADFGKPGKSWGPRSDSTFPLAGNWSKIGVDHMFDHNWKIPYPGVAQLVARLLWEQDVGSSSLSTRTNAPRELCSWGRFLV